MNRSKRIQCSQPKHCELFIHHMLHTMQTITLPVKDEQSRNKEIMLHADIRNSTSVNDQCLWSIVKHCRHRCISDCLNYRGTLLTSLYIGLPELSGNMIDISVHENPEALLEPLIEISIRQWLDEIDVFRNIDILPSPNIRIDQVSKTTFLDLGNLKTYKLSKNIENFVKKNASIT